MLKLYCLIGGAFVNNYSIVSTKPLAKRPACNIYITIMVTLVSQHVWVLVKNHKW